MKRIVVITMILTVLLSCGIRSSQRKSLNSSIEEMSAYALEVIEDSTSTWSQIKRAVNPLSDSIFALINYDGENAWPYHIKGQKIASEIFLSIYFQDSVILRSKNKRTKRQYKKLVTSLKDAAYSWFYMNPSEDNPGSINTIVCFVANDKREEPVDDSLFIGVLLPDSDNPVPEIRIVPPTTSAAPVALLYFMDMDLIMM